MGPGGKLGGVQVGPGQGRSRRAQAVDNQSGLRCQPPAPGCPLLARASGSDLTLDWNPKPALCPPPGSASSTCRLRSGFWLHPLFFFLEYSCFTMLC